MRLRARLGNSVEESLLSMAERLHLCRKRLLYLLERPSISEYEGDSGFDLFRSLRGISDLELLLREVYPLFFDSERRPRVASETGTLVELLNFHSLLVEHSESHHGYPLLYADDYMMDFGFPPCAFVLHVRGTQSTCCGALSTDLRAHDSIG